MVQLKLFENSIKITKPIRLIELFAGIGAQAKALENLKVEFEKYFVCEFDKYVMTSYNAIHNTNFKPSDITKISAKDLNVIDSDKYTYILTYSFPCQDLSLAGLKKGMSENSNTRSSLLWEVKRLLLELNTLREREREYSLPKILLMENVPQVIGSKNYSNFKKWENFLTNLGYKNSIKILNAKDYGVPQNRNRCFMISVLGNEYYNFPNKIELKIKMQDLLEGEVNNKYYLTNRFKKYFINVRKNSDIEQLNRNIINREIANCLTTRIGGCRLAEDNYICKTLPNNYLVKKEQDLTNLPIRRLTPKECYRLMGFSDIDFEKSKKALNDTYYGGLDKSDSRLYKQAGNSIVVNVLESIFKEIL